MAAFVTVRRRPTGTHALARISARRPPLARVRLRREGLVTGLDHVGDAISTYQPSETAAERLRGEVEYDDEMIRL